MFCKNCGKQIKDNTKFCPYCGMVIASKKESEQPVSVQRPASEDQPELVATPEAIRVPSSRDRKSRLIPIIVGAVVLALIVAAVIFFIQKNGVEKENNLTDTAAPIEASRTTTSTEEASSMETVEGGNVTTKVAETILESTDAVRLPAQEVEEEVLSIRTSWLTDKENILNGDYHVKNLSSGEIAYYDEQEKLMIVEAPTGSLTDDLAVTFEYRNDQMIFAFYEGAGEEYRLYFKNDTMFRLDKRIGETQTLKDALYNDSEFAEWEKRAMEEGEAYHALGISETEQPIVSATDTSAVAVNLIDASLTDMTGWSKLSYESCGQSSHVVQPKYDNTAKAAMDGDDTTSWQESVEGAGIGQQVWYQLDRQYDIRYLSFKLGNWRNDRYFYGNNRPKKLKITINDMVSVVEFPTDKQEYWVELSPAFSGSVITFTVEEVYVGTGEYDDTCIAEIGIYGK